ncbi:MAG: MBOAT family protein [Lachnospiraceae bacterium]|nr:MBOAT family protein [Lachnospiraceae bacterium]
MTGTMSTLGFFAIILIIYYILPLKFRWGLLLVASIVFYASADWKMLALIGGSIVVSYYAGLKIEQAEDEKQKRGWMAGCIILLVLILMLFKYWGFFAEAMGNLLGSSSGMFQLVMPLGISYYTFKIISYLADIYKEKIDAEKHFGYYALYVCFFPQILCGPIERADYFIPQLKYGCKFEDKLAAEGLERIIIGLFKKLVIADRLSLYVGTIFDAPMSYPGLASIMAVFFYSIQIYCDFSGYSDMAIGMAQMLGIRTRENFRYPYFSRSIKEFWTRWHISLSSWLKDYIYIPLGGNRKGKLRKNLNTMAVFLVSGIWHGSSLGFVFWGALHGLWNMISTPKKEDTPVWSQILQVLITFLGVTFTWIFFRAKDLTTAFTMIRHMIFGFALSVDQITASLLPFTGDNTCAAYFLIICLLILFQAVFEWRRTRGKGTSYGWLAAMLAIILLLGKFGSSSFLYGQF